MEWFYATGGNRVGPVAPVAFENLVKEGVVKTDTLVWSKGMAEWRPYTDVAAETAVCVSSGGRYWHRDMVPYEGSYISAEHKEQFFQRLREGVSQPNEMVYSGFGRRFLGKLVDGIINWVFGAVANLGLTMLFFGRFIFQPKPTTPELTGNFLAYQGATMLAGIVIGLAYYWFFLHKFAATPGKMAFGMKVVRSDGSALTTGRIIGRYFAEWLSSILFGIGYLMAAFDDERRTLHDRICDTRVIQKR